MPTKTTLKARVFRDRKKKIYFKKYETILSNGENFHVDVWLDKDDEIKVETRSIDHDIKMLPEILDYLGRIIKKNTPR